MSANQVLRGVHQVLTFEKVVSPFLLPSSQTSAYRALGPKATSAGILPVRHKRDILSLAVPQKRSGQDTRRDVRRRAVYIGTGIDIYSPRLYFVKMDIIAAFDTIKQDKMLDIVSRILEKVKRLPRDKTDLNQNHDYCLMLYCLLLPPASQASQASATRRIFKTRAVLDGERYHWNCPTRLTLGR